MQAIRSEFPSQVGKTGTLYTSLNGVDGGGGNGGNGGGGGGCGMSLVTTTEFGTCSSLEQDATTNIKANNGNTNKYLSLNLLGDLIFCNIIIRFLIKDCL